MVEYIPCDRCRGLFRGLGKERLKEHIKGRERQMRCKNCYSLFVAKEKVKKNVR